MQLKNLISYSHPSFLSCVCKLRGGILVGLAVASFASTASAQVSLTNAGNVTINSASGSTYSTGLTAKGTTYITLQNGGMIGSNSATTYALRLVVNNGNSATLTMNGGSIIGNTIGIYDNASGVSNIYSGTITGQGGATNYGLKVDNGGTVNVYGGNFKGSSDAFVADSTGSIINIYGWGLSFSGGKIVGKLTNGDLINDPYKTDGVGQINLITVAPEGDALLLFSGGLLPIGVSIWRRRRRA